MPRLLLVLLLPCAVALADEKKKAPGFKPAFKRGDVVHATDDHIVWVTATAIPSMRRARPSRFRYWVQRTDSHEAVLRADFVHVASLAVVTVLPDDTLCLSTTDALFWIGPDDPPLLNVFNMAGRTQFTVPGEKKTKAQILYADADGFVMQPYETMTHSPLYWIPLNGTSLSFDEKVRISNKQGPYCNSPPPVFKAGSKLAFGFDVYDLETKKRRTLPKIVNGIRAFDGERVADFSNVVHLDDGRVEPLPDYHQVFTFHGGIAYGIHPSGGPKETTIFGFRAGDTRTLWRGMTKKMSSSYFQPDKHGVISVYRRDGPFTVFWNKHGMWVFHDGAWHREPWRTKLPE